MTGSCSNSNIIITKNTYKWNNINPLLKYNLDRHLQKQHRNLTRIFQTFSWQIINPTCSLNFKTKIIYLSTIYVNFIVLRWLICLKQYQHRTCFDIREVVFVYVLIMIKRGVATEYFENIRYYIRKFKIWKVLLRTHIQFNTFQKYSAHSKLSTNTYLMSVAAVFQKLYVKVTKLHPHYVPTIGCGPFVYQ